MMSFEYRGPRWVTASFGVLALALSLLTASCKQGHPMPSEFVISVDLGESDESDVVYAITIEEEDHRGDGMGRRVKSPPKSAEASLVLPCEIDKGTYIVRAEVTSLLSCSGLPPQHEHAAEVSADCAEGRTEVKLHIAYPHRDCGFDFLME